MTEYLISVESLPVRVMCARTQLWESIVSDNLIRAMSWLLRRRLWVTKSLVSCTRMKIVSEREKWLTLKVNHLTMKKHLRITISSWLLTRLRHYLIVVLRSVGWGSSLIPMCLDVPMILYTIDQVHFVMISVLIDLLYHWICVVLLVVEYLKGVHVPI